MLRKLSPLWATYLLYFYLSFELRDHYIVNCLSHEWQLLNFKKNIAERAHDTLSRLPHSLLLHLHYSNNRYRLTGPYSCHGVPPLGEPWKVNKPETRRKPLKILLVTINMIKDNLWNALVHRSVIIRWQESLWSCSNSFTDITSRQWEIKHVYGTILEARLLGTIQTNINSLDGNSYFFIFG